VEGLWDKLSNKDLMIKVRQTDSFNLIYHPFEY